MNSFIDEWKIINDLLTKHLSYRSTFILRAQSYLQEINFLAERVAQLIQQAEEINLYRKPLQQLFFHLNNLTDMTHLHHSVRWQYAEAALEEARIFNRFLNSQKENALSSSNDNSKITIEEETEDTLELTNLPPEIIDNISSFMSYKTLHNFKKTNHFFNQHTFVNEQLKKTLKAIIPTEYRSYFLLSNGQAFVKDENGDSNYTGIKLSNNLPIKEIIVGHTHVIYVDSENKLHTSGINGQRQMGETEKSFIPFHQPVPFSGNSEHSIKKTICAGYGMFIQDHSGKWFGYGDNESNHLGITPRVSHTSAGIPLFSPEIDKIVTGFSHTFFLIKDQWYAAGYGGYGEFGLPAAELPEIRPFPVSLPDNEAIIDIAAGFSTTFFKGASGQWYACGDNNHGSLAIKFYNPKYTYEKSKITKPTAVKLPNGKKILNIICCLSQTYMEDENGNWYGCGQSYSNQLALKENIKKLDVPTPICINSSEHLIKKVNFGPKTSYFLDMNNEWWQFGGAAKTPKKFNIETLLFEEKINSEEAVLNFK